MSVRLIRGTAESIPHTTLATNHVTSGTHQRKEGALLQIIEDDAADLRNKEDRTHAREVDKVAGLSGA